MLIRQTLAELTGRGGHRIVHGLSIYNKHVKWAVVWLRSLFSRKWMFAHVIGFTPVSTEQKRQMSCKLARLTNVVCAVRLVRNIHLSQCE